MQVVLSMLLAAWQVLVLMAPYLLLGFVAASVVSLGMSPAWVRRHMGGRGLWQVVKATLFGIPLPLCSCGVLPVAFSLRRQGAGRGATVAFLAVTPQTGVDSIWVTYGVLGPVVACWRVGAALFSGLLTGALVTWAYPRDPPEPAAPESAAGAPVPIWRQALRQGFMTLPQNLAKPLLLGVLLAGVLTVLVPSGALAGHLAGGWAAYGMALLAGIPLYVCSSASIPLAASFVHMGASPGAAMAFLIAGPATNTAMLLVLWTRIGRVGTALYLLSIAVTALGAGWALDLFFPGVLASVPLLDAACSACATSGWHVAAAVVLMGLLLPGLLPERADPVDEEKPASR